MKYNIIFHIKKSGTKNCKLSFTKKINKKVNFSNQKKKYKINKNI